MTDSRHSYSMSTPSGKVLPKCFLTPLNKVFPTFLFLILSPQQPPLRCLRLYPSRWWGRKEAAWSPRARPALAVSIQVRPKSSPLSPTWAAQQLETADRCIFLCPLSDTFVRPDKPSNSKPSHSASMHRKAGQSPSHDPQSHHRKGSTQKEDIIFF